MGAGGEWVGWGGGARVSDFFYTESKFKKINCFSFLLGVGARVSEFIFTKNSNGGGGKGNGVGGGGVSEFTKSPNLK